MTKSMRGKFRRQVRGMGHPYEVITGIGYWVDYPDGRYLVTMNERGGITKTKPDDIPDGALKKVPKKKQSRKRQFASPTPTLDISGGQVYGFGNLLINNLVEIQNFNKVAEPGYDTYFYFDIKELVQASMYSIQQQGKPLPHIKEEIEDIVDMAINKMLKRLESFLLRPDNVVLTFYYVDQVCDRGAIGFGPITK